MDAEELYYRLREVVAGEMNGRWIPDELDDLLAQAATEAMKQPKLYAVCVKLAAGMVGEEMTVTLKAMTPEEAKQKVRSRLPYEWQIDDVQERTFAVALGKETIAARAGERVRHIHLVRIEKLT